MYFAENGNYQFDHEARALTYTLPTGVKVLDNGVSGQTITIAVDDGTTSYNVKGTFSLDANGNLSVKFDETDPNYGKLTAATNAAFHVSYSAEFTEEAIFYGDESEVVRRVTVEDPEPGEVYANKTATYDETTGTFHYTITVTCTGGDVTDVNVKDVITGNALVFKQDSVAV